MAKYKHFQFFLEKDTVKLEEWRRKLGITKFLTFIYTTHSIIVHVCNIYVYVFFSN